ncbi:MAG: hypothetical protein WCG67_09485, partial [Ferruginibacter sp.]
MKKVTFIASLFFVSCLSSKAQDPFQQYVAKYKFPQGSAVTEVNITMENGSLLLSSTLGNTTIEKTDTDKFYIPSLSAVATFVRNDAKRVTGIKIDIKGTLLDGTREDKTANANSTLLPIY